MSNPDATKPSFSLLRRWGVAFNVVLGVALVALVVLMLNYLAARHFWRWHWGSSPQALSPQTLRLLETLRAQTNHVKIIVYFDRDAPMFGAVKSLLKEYELRCPRLSLEYVNYNLQVGRAALVKAQYKLAADAQDLVIFECGDRRKLVYQRELYDLDLSQFVKTREARRSTFKGELAFSSALVSVADSRRFKACLLRGHGEHDPDSEDDQMGYSRFVQVLREKNILVESLSLLGTNEVPADCQLLVIAGPRAPLPAPELERIERHLGQGGRLLLLLNFQTRTNVLGLEKLLAAWGVDVGRDQVSDKPQTQSGQVEALAVEEFGNHPIVSSLHGNRLLLVLPRSVNPRPGGQNADAARVTELAATGITATALDGRGGERKGRITLAVAVEKGGIQGVSADRGSTRMVIVGESYFLSNMAIESGANRDFANLAVSWLLDRPQLLGGIGPRPVHDYRIAMTRSQMLTARWVLLAGLPGSVLVFGALVWLRRRA